MGRWKNHLLQIFDLPSDVTKSEPRIEWIKNGHLQIENHQGIQSFHPSELQVQVKDQVLFVSGNQLRIETINAYLIIVTGNIDQIRYLPKRR